MALLYLKGLAANLVTQASAYSATSEDSDYPVENVGDGYTRVPFKFDAAGANDLIDIDLGSAMSVSFASIHGHNLDSNITSVTIRKSSDNFSANNVLVATLTNLTSPSFFGTFAATSERYWRIVFVGTNGSPIEVGEWVLGAHTEKASTIKITSLEIESLFPQSRQSGGLVPQVLATQLTALRQRVVNIGIQVLTFSDRDIVENWFVDSKGGAEPFIVVPDDNDSIVIHGRISKSLKWERRGEGVNEFNRTSFSIEEDPFAIAL